MAKSVNPLVLDAALDYLSTNGTRYDICSTAPTNYTQATSTNSLGNTTLSGGDYTKANGTTSGRKTTVAAKTGVSITASGTAAHVAISSGSALLYVTELSSSQAVTSGNTADVASFEIELRDPS
jgi:hypothetical protein